MITNRIKISEAFAGRLDPQFYNPLYFDLLHELNKCNGIRLSKIATLSSESWNQKDYFEGQFPYIEIGSIDLDSGEISNISYLPIQEAPSRAKKAVRKDDIIISTTRPNRGAISLIRVDDMIIASTGFAVIRDISNDILREYLFIVLRLKCSLTQMQQRCSGGNYPAITEDELKKIIIPLPTIATQQKIVGIYQKAQDAKQAKEAEAKALLASIDSEILERLDISVPQEAERRLSFNVGISDVIGKRMDVSFYKDRFELTSTLYPNKKLSDVVIVNPSVNYKPLSPSDEITFLPMEVIDEKMGEVAEYRITTVAETKGFTKFEDDDLLWAKITPCMQNGKSAIARNLLNGVGCGSTEFYVLRPKDATISIDYIYCLLRHHKVLEAAKSSFGGSAGQQRVSSSYLKSISIPVPPIEVQREIAESIYSKKAKAKQLQQEGVELLKEAKDQIEKIILG